MLNKVTRTAFIIAVALGALGQAQAEEKEKKFYDPVPKKLEGWTIKVDPKLLKKEHREFKKEVFKASTASQTAGSCPPCVRQFWSEMDSLYIS